MIEMFGRAERPKKKILIIGAAACVVVLGVLGYIVWGVIFKDPNAANKATAARVIKEVSALYLAPNEEATVVKIEDKSKLTSQTFFDRAENGDFLLIYPKAKQAIIYRESVNKMINAGPVNLPEQGQAPQGTTPAQKK